MDIHQLPTLNACLNFTAAILLILGYKAIKRNNRKLHQQLMIAALICSAAFLTSYLIYHFNVPGMTRYQGEGIFRFIYFSILITHIPLAVLIVPFVIAAVIYAIQGNFQRHTQITKYLLPVWLYVSVTGVLIYLMLYVF